MRLYFTYQIDNEFMEIAMYTTSVNVIVFVNDWPLQTKWQSAP